MYPVPIGEPHSAQTGPGLVSPPHHEHWTSPVPETELPARLVRRWGSCCTGGAEPEASRSGEPQISQTGPSFENSPHHSHAIFVFVISQGRGSVKNPVGKGSAWVDLHL
jgi:hypothetical protein